MNLAVVSACVCLCAKINNNELTTSWQQVTMMINQTDSDVTVTHQFQ